MWEEAQVGEGMRASLETIRRVGTSEDRGTLRVLRSSRGSGVKMRDLTAGERPTRLLIDCLKTRKQSHDINPSSFVVVNVGCRPQMLVIVFNRYQILRRKYRFPDIVNCPTISRSVETLGDYSRSGFLPLDRNGSHIQLISVAIGCLRFQPLSRRGGLALIQLTDPLVLRVALNDAVCS